MATPFYVCEMCSMVAENSESWSCDGSAGTAHLAKCLGSYHVISIVTLNASQYYLV